MARIRGYIATSLDGYIATPDGGVEWLKPFEGHDYGYERFIAEIGTVVLGRATFDQVLDFGWPYSAQRSVLLTHRPAPELPAGVEVWTGDVAPLVPRLRAALGGDVWVVGGGVVQAAFIEAGGLDRLEVFIMPVLLGDGIPLWPRFPRARELTLRAADALGGGVARLDYTIGEPLAGA